MEHELSLHRMRNVFFFFFTILLVVGVHAQRLNGTITDIDGKPISAATIFNARSGDFVSSNSDGFFELDAKQGDTLQLRHIAFKNTNSIVEADSIVSLVMEEQISLLEEVTVSSSKRKKGKIKTKRKSHLDRIWFGPGINSEYLFFIGKNVNDSMLLKGISIPVDYRRGYRDGGLLQFQLFKKTKSALEEIAPLSKVYVLKLESENKFLELRFTEHLFCESDTEYYLFLKRIIVGVEFNYEGSKSLSVNPFLNLEESKEDSMIFDKPPTILVKPTLISNQWVELGKYRMLKNFRLLVELEIEKID